MSDSASEAALRTIDQKRGGILVAAVIDSDSGRLRFDEVAAITDTFV